MLTAHLNPFAALALAAAAVAVEPTVIDAGGGRQTSAHYTQDAAGLGEIGVTAVASVSYRARTGWVGALPEPGSVRFGAARFTARRDQASLLVPVLRGGDEDTGVSVAHVVREASSLIALRDARTALPDEDGTAWLAVTVMAGVGDGNALIRLTAPEGELAIAEPSTALVTVVDGIDGAPRIATTPGLDTIAGERWSYDLNADAAGTGLPHALVQGLPLRFTLIEAPAGVTVTSTGRTTARLEWAATEGEDEHRRIRVRATDPLTGLSDDQEIVLFVARGETGHG